MNANYEALAQALKEQLPKDGDWTWRAPVELGEAFTLTWWPEGWMKGRAYWTEIHLEYILGPVTSALLRTKVDNAIRSLEWHKRNEELRPKEASCTE